MDDLLSDFLAETNESLAELDVALVQLERNPGDLETLSFIFRLVHTIKGTCGFLGLPRLERVAHAAENVLGRVRDGALAVTPEAISLVLSALDCIKEIVAALARDGVEPAADDSALTNALNAVAEGRAATPVPAPALSAPETMAAKDTAPEIMPPEMTAPEIIPAEIMPAETATPAIAPDHAAAAPPPEPAAAHAPEPATQTIRVAVEVLENLMTLVSELVLTRNQLLQTARTQQNSDFTAPLQRLSHITSDLQEGVMKTRMQPIGHAWNKLPRLVRDLSHDLGKKIELVMLGAETELDRQVLELIKDPLTHMVRNSGDHGLETPAQRRAAGKPETGRITLNAYHEGGHIIIVISDDGAGLPVDKIRAKALARKIVNEAELAAMSDAQIQRFIFHAGFSTAAAITAVSGRGVGMDVVKTNIERIGGTIDLKSTYGTGTDFTIKIPLTLAIVSGLIVEAGGERFAIPQISVVELVRVGNGSASSIERINATPVLRLRDQLLPLVSLNDLLALSARPPSDDGATIVVAQVGATLMGIIVDRVFDTEEIVVKPVAPILRHITMFSGNTILGDGSVIMILDPNGIARAIGVGQSQETAGAPRDARNATAPAAAEDASGNTVAMLVFRAGHREPLAVPLSLVARLEHIPRERIEATASFSVTQYRDRLMPLVPLAEPGSQAAQDFPEYQPVLVFSDRDRSMGLMVDQIIDVVQDRLDIQLSASRPGLLGTAIINGQATGVIDTSYWLTLAWHDWFDDKAASSKQASRVLVVEDSSFFRQMLVPTLSAAGYQVTAASSAAQALAMRDAGAQFDAVISDIEMPEMDGLGFARAVRQGGPWASLPLIALTGRANPEDVAAGRNAGFTDYVAKFERDGLLASLRQCLSQPIHAG